MKIGMLRVYFVFVEIIANPGRQEKKIGETKEFFFFFFLDFCWKYPAEKRMWWKGLEKLSVILKSIVMKRLSRQCERLFLIGLSIFLDDCRNNVLGAFRYSWQRVLSQIVTRPNVNYIRRFLTAVVCSKLWYTLPLKIQVTTVGS